MTCARHGRSRKRCSRLAVPCSPPVGRYAVLCGGHRPRQPWLERAKGEGKAECSEAERLDKTKFSSSEKRAPSGCQLSGLSSWPHRPPTTPEAGVAENCTEWDRPPFHSEARA